MSVAMRRTQTLRRSSRLRHLYCTEETDDFDMETSEEQSRREKEDDRRVMEKKSEGEETRKAGKPSSRIPTFQSSLPRRRTATQTATESQLPTKSEVSCKECPIKESGIGPGETSRKKFPAFGDRETALPVFSARIHSYSTDDLAVAATFDPIQSETLEVTSLSDEENCFAQANDSEELKESLYRLGLKVQIDSHDIDPASVPQNKSAKEFQFNYSDTDDTRQIPSEDTQSSEEELEERHVKEAPAALVIEEAPKQCLSVKETKELSGDNSASAELIAEPNESPARSKRQAESKPSTSSKTRGRSFALLCIFPSVLLLLVGFGQHIWLYGVPKSLSHLMVQLELHWLEGFWFPQEKCHSDCRLTLTESIPEGMLFPAGSEHLQSTLDSWTSLLNRANSSVSIVAFYLTLRDSDIGLTDPSAMQGKILLDHLKQLKSRGVKLKIAVNAPQTNRSDADELTATGAEVREVGLKNITGGVVHTKLWVVDKKHMYLGSANMDWRSLTQVKEVGVSVEDCNCLAQDALRIFGVYWELGAQKNIVMPAYWPGRFSALSSIKYPLTVKFNGVPARVYLSSSPPQLSTFGRTDDLSAILSVIADAQKFIYVSVMDYLPMSQFSTEIRFWPAIDSVLRNAACARKVEVNLLVSCWSHSPETMFNFLQSLSTLSKAPLKCNIHIKMFNVPYTSAQNRIPFSRVNHAKYMVTDRVVYIGTSNWSENYFTQTAGIGLVVNQTGSVVRKGQQTVQNRLQKIFQRDWNSDFAQALKDDLVEHCSRGETTF